MGEANTLHKISIKKVISRFCKEELPPKYHVILNINNDNNHNQDFSIKNFDSLTNAKIFAEKLAHFLNEDYEIQST